MKTLMQPQARLHLILVAGLGAAMFMGLAPSSGAEDPKTNSAAKIAVAPPAPGKPAPAGEKAKHVPRAFSGAELYSMNCARCHPERYPNERTAAQWKTIMLHMRVRANLPAEQARIVLRYLQDNSGY